MWQKVLALETNLAVPHLGVDVAVESWKRMVQKKRIRAMMDRMDFVVLVVAEEYLRCQRARFGWVCHHGVLDRWRRL